MNGHSYTLDAFPQRKAQRFLGEIGISRNPVFKIISCESRRNVAVAATLKCTMNTKFTLRSPPSSNTKVHHDRRLQMLAVGNQDWVVRGCGCGWVSQPRCLPARNDRTRCWQICCNAFGKVMNGSLHSSTCNVSPAKFVNVHAAQRARLLPHSHQRCAGNDPIWWTSSVRCKRASSSTSSSPCGRGDMKWALTATKIARCGPRGDSLRHFNRSQTQQCLNRLAAFEQAGAARILLVGMSNMKHTWRALTEDDVFPDDFRVSHGNTAPCGAYMHLPSFLPHRIEYTPWLIVQRNFSFLLGVRKKAEAKCWNSGAIAGPFFEHVVARAATPYHVVAIYVGMWDLSFTAFNATRFENGLHDGVRYLRKAWPMTTVVIFTLTPCGGELPSNPTVARSTPKGVCRLVECANHAIRRVVEALDTPHVQLLDAHQMTTSRPSSNTSGTPPGIWQAQRNGWHFQTVETKRDRDFSRSMTPPSAAGEMNRALANRLLDVVCP